MKDFSRDLRMDARVVYIVRPMDASGPDPAIDRVGPDEVDADVEGETVLADPRELATAESE
jgi:hypothetical protein